MNRIQDPQIRFALGGNTLPGHTRAFSEQVAVTASVLTDCHIWSDVLWGWPEQVVEHAPGLWRVPVVEGWWMVFAWKAPWGPMEQRLYRE